MCAQRRQRRPPLRGQRASRAREEEGRRRMRWRRGRFLMNFVFRSIPNLKFNVRYNYGNIVLIRSENLALIPLLGIRITPPGEAAEEQKNHVSLIVPARTSWSWLTYSTGPFNPYIPIRSTIIGKSRVAIDPIAIRTSWRSNSDIASVTRTNQYNQDLGLIYSTNDNHLESPNEGSSIDHQVTIYLHAQNITMFPTNETWYFASQILVSNSGDLILILTAQSTRNMFRIHSDY
ncbi:triacylglycerol lipase [Dorcoceras hygrometricum]|uniref:Triacylglycerol lipase n=1 Tax=Dorcoceras hygrometricum TaxID=472368 RepID=A0A2Z7CB86_9LAMI|nr:triacylglycerol lipase [Dorcoceras hygrometricum]